MPLLAFMPQTLAPSIGKDRRPEGFLITYAAKIQADEAVLMAPRAVGALRLSAKRRGHDTVIADLRQEGSLKALFPKVRGKALDAVFLNTAGGLTGGDRISIEMEAQERAHIIVSSQAAERAYRAQPGQVAEAKVSLRIAKGGRIDWLPQETILFDQAAISRKLDVDLAGDATALLVEPIVFGRAAMGEAVTQLSLMDHWRVRRDGALVFADAVRLQGNAKKQMLHRAIGKGAGAIATILLAGPSAEVCAGALDISGDSGCSLIAEDLLLVRLVARDGYELRRQMIPVVEALATAPIPRVWRL